MGFGDILRKDRKVLISLPEGTAERKIQASFPMVFSLSRGEKNITIIYEMIYFVYCSAEEPWDAGRVQSRLPGEERTQYPLRR